MIRLAIAGYGSIGGGVEAAVAQNPDMTLTAIFTRRPDDITPCTDVPVVPLADAPSWADAVDVLLLCGGSFNDLPTQGPQLARHFNTVDSFDTHPAIPTYFNTMNAALTTSGKLGLVAAGWDPGLFSLNRLYMEALLPNGSSYTFWGRGISQGHTNAIRQIDGVLDAVQYTCPIESAVAQVRSGSMPILSAAQKHTRECYVVLQSNADATRVTQEIATMPYYFADNETHIHFITQEELRQTHNDLSHKGLVFRSGHTTDGCAHHMSFELAMQSNPAFTANAMVAYARAVYRMAQRGQQGAITVLDIPPALLSIKSAEQLRREVL